MGESWIDNGTISFDVDSKGQVHSLNDVNESDQVDNLEVAPSDSSEFNGTNKTGNTRLQLIISVSDIVFFIV